MKKTSIIAIAIALVLAGEGLFALGRGRGYDGLTDAEILQALPEGSGKTANELSVAEWTSLASAASIAMQEDRYEGGAKFLSFVLPGTGQFMVGDYTGGILRLGAELAIMAGSATAYHYLLPDDLQDSSLSRSERRDLMRDYWEDGDGAKVLPAMGVAAAGFTLSVVNRVLASKDAGKQAREDIESGKVTFEPKIYLIGSHIGFGMRMRIR